MFTNIYDPGDILKVIQRMKQIGGQIGRPGGMKTIVIGMPNTGKSSMLNVIRRHATDRKCTCPMTELILGKAVKTSSQAGLTRGISNVIKVVDDPTIYMSDSPGSHPQRHTK
jgi:ribosome biogenesis GTPase A